MNDSYFYNNSVFYVTNTIHTTDSLYWGTLVSEAAYRQKPKEPVRDEIEEMFS